MQEIISYLLCRFSIKKPAEMKKFIVDMTAKACFNWRAYISVERAMGRQRREQRTPIDDDGPSPERISGERTMRRQRREQRTAIDEERPSRERISA